MFFPQPDFRAPEVPPTMFSWRYQDCKLIKKERPEAASVFGPRGL
jgi:hypothetical protein